MAWIPVIAFIWKDDKDHEGMDGRILIPVMVLLALFFYFWGFKIIHQWLHWWWIFTFVLVLFLWIVLTILLAYIIQSILEADNRIAATIGWLIFIGAVVLIVKYWGNKKSETSKSDKTIITPPINQREFYHESFWDFYYRFVTDQIFRKSRTTFSTSESQDRLFEKTLIMGDFISQDSLKTHWEYKIKNGDSIYSFHFINTEGNWYLDKVIEENEEIK